LENGYEIQNIIWAYEFKRGDNTFRDLITILNQMKIEGQVQGKPTIRNLAKLLMNSMYGRFGLKPNLGATNIINPEDIGQWKAAWFIDNQIELGNKLLIDLRPNLEYIYKTHGEETYQNSILRYSNNNNVAIAGAVTAYSRILINQFKLKALELGAELFYSDTDSIVINRKLPVELISSTELGLMKLEHIIEEGIFVMPKVYYLKTKDEEVFKCKGYSGRLTREQYLELMNGNVLNLTVNRWERSLVQGSVRITREVPYELKFSFNKRVQVFNENGRWINTRPIQLS
jgi:DNA polymerase elongation subunit (family B)